MDHISHIRLVDTLSLSVLDDNNATQIYHSKSDGSYDTLDSTSFPSFLNLLFFDVRHFGVVQVRFYAGLS